MKFLWVVIVCVLLIALGCSPEDPLGVQSHKGYFRFVNDSSGDAEVGVEDFENEIVQAGTEREWTIDLGDSYTRIIAVYIKYTGSTGIYHYTIEQDMVKIVTLTD